MRLFVLFFLSSVCLAAPTEKREILSALLNPAFYVSPQLILRAENLSPAALGVELNRTGMPQKLAVPLAAVLISMPRTERERVAQAVAQRMESRFRDRRKTLVTTLGSSTPQLSPLRRALIQIGSSTDRSAWAAPMRTLVGESSDDLDQALNEIRTVGLFNLTPDFRARLSWLVSYLPLYASEIRGAVSWPVLVHYFESAIEIFSDATSTESAQAAALDTMASVIVVGLGAAPSSRYFQSQIRTIWDAVSRGILPHVTPEQVTKLQGLWLLSSPAVPNEVVGLTPAAVNSAVTFLARTNVEAGRGDEIRGRLGLSLVQWMLNAKTPAAKGAHELFEEKVKALLQQGHFHGFVRAMPARS